MTQQEKEINDLKDHIKQLEALAIEYSNKVLEQRGEINELKHQIEFWKNNKLYLIQTLN